MSAMSVQIRQAMRLAAHNRRLLLRKLVSRLRRFQAAPGGRAVRTMRGVRFEFDFTLDPCVKQMYDGSYQAEVVDVLERYLPAGGTFIDVGANIGYLSAIALGLVGKTGVVHSFEPVPQYAARLQTLADSNPDYSLSVHRVALGEHQGRAVISAYGSGNIGWNTMVPGLMAEGERARELEVDVTPLTAILHQQGVENVSLVKIDCEGYELPVLRGMTGFLRASGQRPPIVCEVAPQAYARLGASLQEVEVWARELDYRAVDLIDRRQPVPIAQLSRTTDVLFLAA